MNIVFTCINHRVLLSAMYLSRPLCVKLGQNNIFCSREQKVKNIIHLDCILSTVSNCFQQRVE